jgi:hypothetical protein
MFIYLSGGDDFEFAAPGSSTAYNGIFMPQSKFEERAASELPAVSIGNQGSPSANINWSELCVGERILSVKQMVMRQNPLFQQAGQPSPLGAVKNMCIDPWFTTGISMNTSTGLQQYDWSITDFYSVIANMYAMFRGSINVIITFDGSESASSDYLTACNDCNFLTNQYNATDQHWYCTTVTNTGLISNTISTVIGSGQKGFGGNASFVSQKTSCSEPFVVRCPYQNRLPVSLVRRYCGAGLNGSANYLDQSMNISCLTITCNTNMNNFGGLISRAVSDNFQFCFFIGCPPLYTGWS